MTIETPEQALSRMEQIHARMETLAAKHRLSTAESAEFTALRNEFNELANLRDRSQKAADLIAGYRSGRYRVDGGLADVDNTIGDGSTRDQAMRTLEAAVRSDRVGAAGAELVERVMGSGSPISQTWTQRWTIATGSPAYERAFTKKLADPDNGHLTWTPEEAEAWRTASLVQAESRAMSLTDAAGGFLVPFTLDPTVNISGAGSINPLRQLARVVQTASDSWNGVTSAGVTAEWLGEGSEAADASPTLAQPSIPVHKASAFVPYSFEIGMDGTNFIGELSKLLLDAYDNLTATAYTTGSGSGQPTGIITKLVASSGTVALVAPATAETLAAADVFAVQNALPPRFQARATWQAALATLNSLRQFETSAGALKFPGLQETPPQLLGRAVYENSAMDGTINPAATENNYPIVYGDVGAGMVIVDRIGSTIEIVQNLFGANRRPTGQRGALLWARTGADVIMPQAFRLISIPTSA